MEKVYVSPSSHISVPNGHEWCRVADSNNLLLLATFMSELLSFTRCHTLLSTFHPLLVLCIVENTLNTCAFTQFIKVQRKIHNRSAIIINAYLEYTQCECKKKTNKTTSAMEKVLFTVISLANIAFHAEQHSILHNGSMNINLKLQTTDVLMSFSGQAWEWCTIENVFLNGGLALISETFWTQIYRAKLLGKLKYR
jgi:hypothetical protein